MSLVYAIIDETRHVTTTVACYARQRINAGRMSCPSYLKNVLFISFTVKHWLHSIKAIAVQQGCKNT